MPDSSYFFFLFPDLCVWGTFDLLSYLPVKIHRSLHIPGFLLG